MNMRTHPSRALNRKRHVVILMGRMGNQFFQFSFARWLEAATNTPVCFDLSYLRQMNNVATPLKRIMKKDAIFYSPFLPTLGGRLDPAAKILRQVIRPARIEIDRSALGRDVSQQAQPAWWLGYWQRLQYAEHARKEIQFLLGFEDGSVSNRQQTCVVHVRRGDYVALSLSLPLIWYKEAMARVRMEAPTVRFLVVSDDIHWCIDNFPPSESTSFVQNGDTLSDLALMARADFNIISRSTFAWWGAFLGSSQTYYPQHWDPANPEDDNLVIPGNWRPVPTPWKFSG